MTSRTGCKVDADLPITSSTSLVAFWKVSDSSRSRVFAWTSSNSRTFWMAIAAWSANVFKSSICFSLNCLTSVRRMTSTPIGLLVAHQRRGDKRAMARLPGQLLGREETRRSKS